MYQKGKERAWISDYREIILTSLPQLAIEKLCYQWLFFGERQPVNNRHLICQIAHFMASKRTLKKVLDADQIQIGSRNHEELNQQAAGF